jgi:hypothetical protein
MEIIPETFAMEDLRLSSPRDRLALKAAVNRAVDLAGGPSQSSHVTRGCASDLSRYGNQNYPDRHCPIDVVLDLDRAARSPVIAAALAEAEGYRLVAVDRQDVGEISMADVVRIVTEAGEAAKAIAESDRQACGRYTHAAKLKVNAEIEEAVAVLRCIQARINYDGDPAPRSTDLRIAQ